MFARAWGERLLTAQCPLDIQATYQMIERGLPARTVRLTVYLVGKKKAKNPLKDDQHETAHVGREAG